jgi:Pyrimidine dimer DNA glycosylase
MNIFVLDNSPRLAATMHCDKHVSKMILESAQMLCSVINERGGTTPYRTTHKNHPCTIWARASQENFNWLTELSKELNKEYRKRYGKQINHKSWEIIKQTVRDNAEIIRSLPNIGPTPFAQAMPDEYKDSDPVTAYRSYYKHAKRDIAEWRYSTTPWWWA